MCVCVWLCLGVRLCCQYLKTVGLNVTIEIQVGYCTFRWIYFSVKNSIKNFEDTSQINEEGLKGSNITSINPLLFHKILWKKSARIFCMSFSVVGKREMLLLPKLVRIWDNLLEIHRQNRSQGIFTWIFQVPCFEWHQ